MLTVPGRCRRRRERPPLRAGYMGHLTDIANSLQSVAARRPTVARALCSSSTWTDFAFGPLTERNTVRALTLARACSGRGEARCSFDPGCWCCCVATT